MMDSRASEPTSISVFTTNCCGCGEPIAVDLDGPIDGYSIDADQHLHHGCWPAWEAQQHPVIFKTRRIPRSEDDQSQLTFVFTSGEGKRPVKGGNRKNDPDNLLEL